MKAQLKLILVFLLLALPTSSIWADEDIYTEATTIFKNAGESGSFFNHAYGYALFPGVGKGGMGIGAAHGSGRVYQQGAYVGDTSMTQISFGLQLGGQAFSQIIFFQDKRAFEEFTRGNFEFEAGVGAIAITASANASTSTTGNTAGASGGQNNAKTTGGYNRGMAIFTVAKGGLMYEATIAGQKFSYEPRK